MEIKGTGPDGSLIAEPDFFTLGHELNSAKLLAEVHDNVVRFTWNDVPIAVAGDSDLSLIMRQFESRQPEDQIVEIGPYPDPTTTPEFSHGTFVVEIGR